MFVCWLAGFVVTGFVWFMAGFSWLLSVIVFCLFICGGTGGLVKFVVLFVIVCVCYVLVSFALGWFD